MHEHRMTGRDHLHGPYCQSVTGIVCEIVLLGLSLSLTRTSPYENDWPGTHCPASKLDAGWLHCVFLTAGWVMEIPPEGRGLTDMTLPCHNWGYA